MKFIIILHVFLLFIYTQISANDSTLVRIRTDVDSVEFKINDSIYVYDNYGNLLSANNWFIISLTKGEYHFVLQFEDQIVDTVIIIENQELIALEFPFIQEQAEIEIGAAEESSYVVGSGKRIFVMSVPDSGFITVDGKTLEMLTPTFFAVEKDRVTVEVYKDGYEPLVTDLMAEELQRKQVQFILRPMSPNHLNADSLGYTLEKLVSMYDIRVVERIENKYMGMAETFMIFPFAQGLIAKLVLDEDDQTIADIMVSSGAVLSAGSYLLSKILSKKKMKEIKDKNIEVDKQNIEIKNSNKQIELLVRQANAKRVIKWQDENADKGVVTIIESEE